MPRLNIEDSLWDDDRYQKYVGLVKDPFIAIGALVMAWKLAQRFWCPNQHRIPLSRWQSAGFPEAMLECGLAKIEGDFVYVRGTREQFAWYFKKVEAGKKGGVESGKRRKKIKEFSKQPETKVKQPEPNEPSYSPSPSPSSSFSSSPSSSFSNTNTNTNTSTKNRSGASTGSGASHPLKADAFIARYCDSWKERYKTQKNPAITGKIAGIAKRLVKDLGVERATALVEAYLEMEDSWFLKKRHGLVEFEQNLNAVIQFHETGEGMNSHQIKNSELTSNFERQMRAIEEGRI
jgi:hypothetical protein